MMKIKKIILWCCIFLLLVLPLVVQQYRRNAPLVQKQTNVIHVDDLISVHDERVRERIVLLKKQTLEQSFDELLEDQQYFYPGGVTDIHSDCQEMEILFSTRTFLKVFQQFRELPREQALKVLPLFCERAIKGFGDSMDQAVARKGIAPPPGTPMISGLAAKRRVCASMLLAAHLGEYNLIFDQIDTMQALVDSFIERARDYDPDGEAGLLLLRNIATLDDDCILTVLMYALKQKEDDGNIDLPDTIEQRVYPLYRWDAGATYSDFLVQHGIQQPDPKSLNEKFTVYVFPGRYFPSMWFDNQQQKYMVGDQNHKRKAVIDALKERLSK